MFLPILNGVFIFYAILKTFYFFLQRTLQRGVEFNQGKSPLEFPAKIASTIGRNLDAETTGYTQDVHIQ